MSAPSERGLSGKVSGLDHEPTAGELGIADGPSDEYRSGPSEPTADLPSTLASVDDVRRVCEAAGLNELDHAATETERTWMASYCVSPTSPAVGVLPFGVDMFKGTPATLLWHAIQAARSAS